MLLLTISALALLLAILHRLGRNLLFPPELFVGTWLLSLIAVLLSRNLLFEVDPKALAIYVVGATAFSAGGVLANSLGTPSTVPSLAPVHSRLVRIVLDVLLVALALALPFYWNAISGSVDDVEKAAILNAIRNAQLERVDEASSFSPVLNLAVLAQFTAGAMYWESTPAWNRRWRTAAAVVLGLVYGAMSGTKGNAVVLLLMLFFVSSVRARRIRFGSLAVSFGLALVLFSLGLLTVNFAWAGFSGTGEALSGVAEAILVYWLGGIVAFGTIAANPNAVESTQPINRFFLETARSLGMSVDVPSVHAQFTNVATYWDTNTYTIYFSYFKDHGWLGMIALMAGLGAGLAALYRAAMRGRTIAVLVFARLAVSVVLSFQAEHFVTQLNELIKLVAFLFALYGLLPAVARRAQREASHA